MAAKMNEPSSALLLRDELGKQLFSAYHFINPTVANTALVMGYNLGFKNFYLMGIDLGHKQDGHHHSTKSLYYTQEDNDLEEDSDLELYNVNNDSLIEVDGNFGGKFLCDTFFHQSNYNLSHQILGFNDLHCFNLSDGAQIKGSLPLNAESAINIFDKQPSLSKEALLNKVNKNSTHVDDELLFSRLVADLDYQYFDEVCDRLLQLNGRKVCSFTEATVMLLNNTIMLDTLTEHVHALLQGTIMHIQVVLTQLLYSAPNEKVAVESFNKGMVFYCQFIEKAAIYYKENAEQAHFIKDAKWIVKLRNS